LYELLIIIFEKSTHILLNKIKIVTLLSMYAPRLNYQLITSRFLNVFKSSCFPDKWTHIISHQRTQSA